MYFRYCPGKSGTVGRSDLPTPLSATLTSHWHSFKLSHKLSFISSSAPLHASLTHLLPLSFPPALLHHFTFTFPSPLYIHLPLTYPPPASHSSPSPHSFPPSPHPYLPPSRVLLRCCVKHVGPSSGHGPLPYKERLSLLHCKVKKWNSSFN